MKDSLLFAEGFIGAAGSMVSETAIGAVDLTQIIGIASIDGVNRLTGGQTPEWMKRDLQGTADNLSSLAELGVGTYTALTDPGAAQRGQDPNASYADKAAYRAQQTGKALWDKVTHMDAYDAGGLTFEIASLFVGPAAVGKMAKGTKLGAKAAEMIQLAKNSTKAKILANVEKWGSKVDNILAKSNNVIGKFGEKLLDTRIPVGIRKEAVAFAGGMGTMPAFSVESKTLRDVMHFSSKHADDVVRGVGGSGRTERNLEAVLEKAKKGEPVSTYQERLNQTPVNEGHWTGERGESTFVSNKDEVRKILDDVNLEGIEYENAIPDFSPVSKGEVKITDMGIDRNANFRQADELLARELGKTRREIVKFRKENKLTWHELNDMTSMQLVPSIINSKFGHLGGVSEVKKLLELLQ